MNWLKKPLRAAFDGLESMLDAICGPQHNPLAQLGALGWFMFWLIAGTGIYLYVFFDTGVTQAYASIESITRDQWWAGGIMRSIHRYASDALVVIVAVHLLREFAMDRMRGKRWFAWVTGLVLVGFIYACGITGYWMVWDQLAQYVALTTSRWLDALPIFAEPISRNFISNAELSGRFFTLMVYVHIAAPLLMLLFMWVHIQRYNYARVNPTRRLMIATVAAFVLLSLLDPALSQAPADLDALATQVGLDWFYLPLYPLIDEIGGAGLWLLVVGMLVVLAVLPWVPPLRTAPPAVVHLDNCNGCARCFADCPFSAITMQPRSDGAGFSEEAVVDADLCVSCGICVGACPTATPFRRATALVPGIELPEVSIAELRERVEALCRATPGGPRILAFRCAHSAAIGQAAGDGVAVIDVPCTGMIPPSFVDLVVMRGLARGVMLAGCRESDCFQRLGVRWTEARLASERDPYLRDRVPRERVAVSWASPGQRAARASDVSQFAAALGQLDPALPKGVTAAGRRAWRRSRSRPARPLRYATQGLLVVASGVLVGFFSDSPVVRLRHPDEAIVTLSFSHPGRPQQECRRPTPEELAKLEPNMRRSVDCPRARWPVYVELELDGSVVYAGTRKPAGLWDDGPSSLFQRFTVPAGKRHVTARLRDSGRDDGFDYSRSAELDLEPGQSQVIEFGLPEGFVFR